MSDFVKASQVFVDNPAASREEVLQLLSDEAVALGMAEDAAAVRAAYDAREEMGATGMQDGFAIPHAKSDAIKDAGVIVVKLQEPVEWPSFDDKPVDIVISLLVPDGEAGTTHIKLLSNVAVMLMREEFRDAMRATDDAEAIADIINSNLDE